MATALLSDLAEAAADIARATARRNALIIEARQAGHEWADIAEAADMTRGGVNYTAKLVNGGTLPVPK